MNCDKSSNERVDWRALCLKLRDAVQAEGQAIQWGAGVKRARRELGVVWEEVEQAEKSPVETTPEPRLSTMYVSRICTAYESGFGRGLSKRDVAQPYASGSPESLAYFEGYTRAVAKIDAVEPSGDECLATPSVR